MRLVVGIGNPGAGFCDHAGRTALGCIIAIAIPAETNSASTIIPGCVDHDLTEQVAAFV